MASNDASSSPPLEIPFPFFYYTLNWVFSFFLLLLHPVVGGASFTPTAEKGRFLPFSLRFEWSLPPSKEKMKTHSTFFSMEKKKFFFRPPLLTWNMEDEEATAALSIDRLHTHTHTQTPLIVVVSPFAFVIFPRDVMG